MNHDGWLLIIFILLIRLFILLFNIIIINICFAFLQRLQHQRANLSILINTHLTRSHCFGLIEYFKLALCQLNFSEDFELILRQTKWQH